MSLKKIHFLGGHNFLGLPPEDARYDDAHAVILPVPYDGTTSYRPGTRDGPGAIISASRQVELFDPELDCEPLSSGIHTLPELEPVASGPEAMVRSVEKAVRELLADGKFPVMLGGEHSLTTGPVRAFKDTHGKPFSVLQLDAHADLRDSYEGTPFNHACVMRRIFPLAKLTQVGIRNISRGEVDFVRKEKHRGIFWAQDLQGPAQSWIHDILERISPSVYITIDLDVFDPSIMPAVGTPEPGGLLWYPVLELLKEVVQKRTVIGFDVNELAPIPGNIAPDFMAAKLVFKLLAYIFKKNRWIGRND